MDIANTGAATVSGHGIANTGYLYIGKLVQNQPRRIFRLLRPPPALREVPAWVVGRAEADAVIAAVCARRGRAVGITTALQGAGGFGKTTLAHLVCASRRVRRRFGGRVYVVTVGRDVRGRAAIAAKISEATRFITGDTTAFDDPDLAGAHLGRLLDQHPRRRSLLVLDDVWEQDQLDPFLIGGDRCVRLVTTRISSVLPPHALQVRVDQMSTAQARKVLTWELPLLPEDLTRQLQKAAGRWPLLLRLTNRMIATQVATGADPVAAAEEALSRLREHGPAAVDDPSTPLDLDHPAQRRQMVRATVQAASSLLPEGAQERFAELAVFAEDEAVPIPLVAALWHATAELGETESRRLCQALASLSLLTVDATDGGRLTLHDVIRDYLRAELGTRRVTEVNAALLDAAATTLPEAAPLAPSAPQPRTAWWELDNGYLLDHLIYHLLAAGRTEQAEAVASDIRWVETRLHQRGPTAPWSDSARIPTTASAQRAREISSASHLLTPTEPAHALTAILHSRLEHLSAWHDQIQARQALSDFPALINLGSPPDIPDPALLRNLTGHTGQVVAVAIAPDGTWLTTASSDKTVRIWDPATGRQIAKLTGHTDRVWAVAIAPDGTWLATAGEDGTVRIWDRVTGRQIAKLTGHTDWVRAVAIAPDGTWLTTASDDKTVRIWDRVTGRQIAKLTGHTDRVWAVAIAPDGTWLTTAARDNTIRIWDRASGRQIANLTGHTDWVFAVAIAPDGTWLAATGKDGTVRIWDRATAQQIAKLTGHTDWVHAVAIAPDGTWLATAGEDGTVRIWDRATAQQIANLTGHTGPVRAVAIAPDGTWLATAGEDGTVRIWDRATAQQIANLTGHTDSVRAVAIAPDGTWLTNISRESAKTVRIWDRVARQYIPNLTGRTDSRRAIAPNGTWLATTGDDNTIRIWDRVAAHVVAFMRTDEDLYTCVWTPDGSAIAVLGKRGVYFYEFRPGRPGE
ncbi:NB-ARC domain-containing protein [Kitasatospora sp. NPDC001159]